MARIDALVVRGGAGGAGGAGYHEKSRPDVLQVAKEIGLKGSVCDFGCGAGIVGEALLRARLVTSVIGIERDPAIADIARSRLDHVFTADVADGLDLLPSKFDGVILADILEHLEEPANVLSQVIKRLPEGGKAIISLPNVRHLRVSLGLLVRNEWEYVEEGICDSTHLRFFTSKSAERLVLGAGLVPMVRYGTVSGRGQRLCRISSGLTTLLSTQLVYGCVKVRDT